MATTNILFDPNGPANDNSGIFGLPYTEKDAELILIPVPWDVTVSYTTGAGKGPAAILEASKQVDLFLPDVPNAWEHKIHMLEVPEHLRKQSKKARKAAEHYIDFLLNSPAVAKSAEGKELLTVVNSACHEMNSWVYDQSKKYIKAKKKVALIGGDHSTPLGIIKALAETGSFSILHVDAHCDLRKSYEDFTYSHASIMYNALKIKEVKNIVQVGIRDWCQEEQDIIAKSKGRVKMYSDERLKNEQYNGKSWSALCDEMIKNLDQRVYISFDIDGLDPKLCPNTGTPVPGGLEYHQALMLIKKVVASGRKIVGFDVVEVAPGKEDEWDANVGARLIYQMANQMLVSGKKPVPKQK
jgi:agmatinase